MKLAIINNIIGLKVLVVLLVVFTNSLPALESK